MVFNLRILSLASACLLGISQIGQADDKLPSLATDSKITAGELGNGIKYYIVENDTEKGLADVALVQKTGFKDETPSTLGETVVGTRGSLSGLPRFSEVSPFRYLSGKGICPGEKGYANIGDDAIVYRFNDLLISQTSEALDSTLLMVFDMVEAQSQASDRYSPGNQAVVVSGDVDASSVLSKMNMLSMIVTKKPAPQKEMEYSWTERQGPELLWEAQPSPRTATLCVSYSLPRVSRENMASVQPLVSFKFASDLGLLARKRVAAALRSESIPYSSIEFEYVDGSQGPGDEQFKLSIATDTDFFLKVVEIIARELSSIDSKGTIPAEYRDIQNESAMSWYYLSSDIGNDYYITACISSYLYGSSLASPQSRFNFFAKKNVADEVNVRLFNSYASALLDGERNVALICGARPSSFPPEKVKEAFSRGWSSESEVGPLSFSADTTGLSKPANSVKLKNEASEPMVDGKVWTFPNGIKVIFKQSTASSGVFSYNLLLKSGFARASQVKRGEYAYLSDIFGLSRVSGVSGAEFSEMLRSNGVALQADVSVSDFEISGSAPSSKLSLLLKSLLALGYERTVDDEAFAHYVACEKVRVGIGEEEAQRRKAELNKMLVPGYEYYSQKEGEDLRSDLPTRADQFFNSAFSRVNDGVLIIVGDLSESATKKMLCQYIGGFKTDNSQAGRTRSRRKDYSGVRSKFEDGREAYLGLAFSTPINYTAENGIMANVAAIAVARAVGSAAASAGWTTNWESNFIMFPEERLNLYFSMSMAATEGLPASMVQVDSVEEVSARVKAAVEDLARKGLSEKEFSAYLSQFGNTLKARLQETEMIEDMLVLRYSYGKDLMSNYEDKIKAVTLGKVNTFLASMAGGSIAEYGVRNPVVGEVVVERPLQEIELGVYPSVASVGDTLGVDKLYWRLFEGCVIDGDDYEETYLRSNLMKDWIPKGGYTLEIVKHGTEELPSGVEEPSETTENSFEESAESEGPSKEGFNPEIEEELLEIEEGGSVVTEGLEEYEVAEEPLETEEVETTEFQQ